MYKVLTRRLTAAFETDSVLLLQIFTGSLLHTLRIPGILSSVGAQYVELLCQLTLRDCISRTAEDNPFDER